MRRLFSIKHVNVGLITKYKMLCFVDRACLYNLVNKAKLVHSLSLVYLPISTCFERLCAHHQEKQLCRINTVVSPDDGHIVARNM